MKLAETLGSLLRERRMTLRGLSKKSGIALGTLHGWSKGKSAMNLDQLKIVAGVLEVSIHQLAFGEPDPYQDQGTELLSELFKGDVRVTIQKIERKKAG